MAEACFVAAADLHLGRTIASLPEALRDRSRELGPFGALERIVDLAKRERVDAVLLAGDVVDDDGAYFEVFAALQDAVAKLDGVPLMAVAGNHDARVLPRLADAIDGLTLLGPGGTWQSHTIETVVGGVEILGWSFPAPHCTASPFETTPPPRSGPRIGMLHGDVDAPKSVYAPFRPADLREHSADAWLLGHVHVPSHERLGSETPSGYLGSACGLDPREPGPRGAWLLRFDGSRATLEHRPLAPIAWANVLVECGGIEPGELDASLQREAERAASGFPDASAVGVRMTLIGEHEAWRDLHAKARSVETLRPWRHTGGSVFIENLAGRVTPPLPLEQLAVERTAAGRIAGLILDLQRGEADELVGSATDQFAATASNRYLRPPDLGERVFELPDARQTLVREARAMLGELLAQRGEEDD